MKSFAKSGWIAISATVLGLALTVVPVRAQDPFRAASPDVENALKSRIEEFYDYFRQAKFRQAEQLVLEESRDLFYNAKKARIFGYEIRTIHFSEDLTEAKVLVTCLTIVSGLGSKPLPVPLPSTWRSVDGEWFLYFQTRMDGEKYASPAGAMRFNKELGTPGSLNAVQPATIDSLKNMYSVTPDYLAFSSQATEPVAKSIRVENRSKGELTLDMESGELPGVTIDLGAAKLAAGESLTVTVTYIPHALTGLGEYVLRFAVQPLAQHFEIKMVIE